MKKLLLISCLVVVSFISNQSYSQTNSSSSDKSFFELQQEFNDYWGPKNVVNGYYIENGERKKAAGWKQFKRWEYYWESRVDPQTGAFPKTGRAEIYQQIQKSNGSRNVSGNWQSLGPNSTTGGYAGIGRINVVGFRTGDNNTLYAGSPSGGLWKTTDDGGSWTVLTDDNAVLGVSDIIVIAGASTATDVVYIATGDRDGGSMHSLSGGQYRDNNSIGVLKSTDGGTTWSTTGLSFTTSQQRSTNRLLVDPNTSTTIYAATSAGLYKTTDGGVNWPSIWTGAEFISMEFKPGDATIMYGATRGGTIYKSDDSGASWTSVATTGGSRVQLAVSANDPTVVYAVANSSSGLDGIYKSTDSGTSYSKVFDGSVSGNNILGYYCGGTGTATQGSYDLAIAADPTDINTVYVGGINTWKSTDGGTNWSSNNMWTSSSTYNGCGSPVVHADKHFLGFQNGTSTLYEGNDGGIYKTTDGGTTWTDKSSNMVISQIYRLGVSQTSSGDIIGGLQDNGSKYRSSGTWTDVTGGDGMECAINPTSISTQYASYVNGELYRTTDSWATNPTTITPGSAGSGAWVTPYSIDPNTNTTLYAGYSDVWKSTNQGTGWSQISSWGGSTLRSLAVAPSNSNYIYTATRTTLYATTDGGSNWTDVTGTLPVGSAYITYISVKSDDPSTIWVSFGGYNSYGVYESTDGGSSWSSISTGLPSIPVMCVIQNKQNTTDNELYAGTDVGVYVKVGSADWAAYNSGLPNVVVAELEIYYNSSSPNLSRLRAATFGRGLWETELYSTSTTAPVSDFEADDVTPVVDQTVNFTNLTINDPTSYLWTFSPATVTYLSGTSSTSAEPIVKFTAAGTYQVSLYTENANGNDTETKSGYITAAASPTYCSAYSTNPAGTIARVQLGSIDKTSTYTNTGGADPNDTYYEDWTAYSTDIAISSSNSITVTNASTNSGLDLGIWIDWNKDGDFTDTNEEVLCGIDNGGAGTFTINVPADALLGSTRMRLRTKYYGSTCSSCGSTANGEVEDYSVNITASSISWNGNSSTDWATAGNWSGSSVPNSSNNVTIPTSPSGGVFPVIGSGTTSTEVNDLTIESGASLTISGHLTVDGTLTNNAGNSGIVIESSSSATGSLLTNTDGINATVKRYLSGGKWHLIGAPTNGATVNNLYFSGSPEVWLKSYNESSDTWSYITDVNTVMSIGDGYATWVETGNNVTASFTGTTKAVDLTLNSGSTPALAFTDASHGYNLVANPFTCPIDWDQGGWTRTNIDGSIYVWKDGSNYLTRNSYGLGSLPEGIIPVGQGFFVRTTASSPSLTIPKLARVQSSAAYSSPEGETYEGPPYAVLQVGKDDKTDEVWFTFSDEFSDDYEEGWDASKRFGDGNAPQLYTHINNFDLSIVAVSEIGFDGKFIPLNFEARIPGTYELVFKDQKFLDEVDVLLEDLHLNKIQDMNQSPVYSFNALLSDNPDRFIIHFNPKILSIDDKELSSDILIYSWKKDIYLKAIDNESLLNARIQIFDIYGRQLDFRETDNSLIVKIPVNVSNSYLIVKVVRESSIVVKKVFIQ